jgi:hydroxymethylpyrimidine/phosphomethylpyrimidine kinase
VSAVASEIIVETLSELAADMEIVAVHIGMLGSGHAAKAVADFLTNAKLPSVVLDPVLKSSSGADLLDKAGLEILTQRLLPMATVITPNVDEAAALTGLAVTNLDEMRLAAAKLHELGASGVVVTGGHLDKAIDLLSFIAASNSQQSSVQHPSLEQSPIQQEVFKAERQHSNSTHGTGCAFATAIACHLAQGKGLPEAVLLAKAYVRAAIVNAHPLGRGVGPVHHHYRMHEVRRGSSAEPAHKDHL